MFTNIISAILMAISLVSVQPEKVAVEVVEAPDLREQVLILNEKDLDNSIELFESVKNTCTRNGCSLAAHK